MHIWLKKVIVEKGSENVACVIFVLTRTNSLDKSEGTFKVSIGNLSPQKECVLKIRYVSELEVDEDYLKFSLPVTACRLQKVDDEQKASGIRYTSSHNLLILVGLAITLDLKMPSNIEEIFSATHKINQKIDGKSGLVKMLDQASNGIFFLLVLQFFKPNSWPRVGIIYQITKPTCTLFIY